MEDIAVLLPKLLSIFALAFFYFWPAIPAGLALGLPPLLVIITTSLSYACGVVVVTLLGERVRGWVIRNAAGTQSSSSLGTRASCPQVRSSLFDEVRACTAGPPPPAFAAGSAVRSRPA